LVLGDPVAGVDVAVGDEPVDVGTDFAIAQFELGQCEVLLGLLDLRPRRLDARRLVDGLLDELVDVAVRGHLENPIDKLTTVRQRARNP
jgi:hypothetical protein